MGDDDNDDSFETVFLGVTIKGSADVTAAAAAAGSCSSTISNVAPTPLTPCLLFSPTADKDCLLFRLSISSRARRLNFFCHPVFETPIETSSRSSHSASASTYHAKNDIINIH